MFIVNRYPAFELANLKRPNRSQPNENKVEWVAWSDDQLKKIRESLALTFVSLGHCYRLFPIENSIRIRVHPRSSIAGG